MMKWFIIVLNLAVMVISSAICAADGQSASSNSVDLEQIQRLQQIQQTTPTTNSQASPSPSIAASVPLVASSSSQPPPPPILPPQSSGAVIAPPVEQVPNDTLTLRDQAFAGVTESMLPMSPAQIRRLRELFSEIQQSTTELPGVPPKPTSTSVVVNLAPGATPPVVRLSAGFVTSLVFIDATGSPWPIDAYDVGDPKSFNIQWDKKGNTLLVQATNLYKQGNIAVMLKDLNTPIMVTLIPGQQAIDYRVDMQVPRMGPNAEPSMNGLPNGANPELLNVLNGVPPNHAQSLKVSGGECQAWITEGKLFLRTPLTIISPSWVSMMSGPDGAMHAYELPKASVILALQQGKMIKLTLEGF